MKRGCLLLLLWTVPCGVATAQGNTAGSPPPKAEPVPNTDVGKSGGTLSDKLNATSGVIHPEGTVDPAMQKPAPATGTMPVIKPPGSPGGPAGVEPK